MDWRGTVNLSEIMHEMRDVVKRKRKRSFDLVYDDDHPETSIEISDSEEQHSICYEDLDEDW